MLKCIVVWKRINMKVLIVAGGTGGHIFPAVTLAQEIMSKGIARVLFVASSRKQDREILLDKGMEFQTLPIIPLKSRSILGMLEFGARLFAGTIKSIIILLSFRPNVLIGFGGFVSGPIALLASLSGIRTIIHEQNVYPGIANRILAGFADRIAISFEETLAYLKRYETKIIFSGNPLRQGLKEAGAQKSTGDGFRVLVIGGSQGSHKLNTLIPETIGLLDKNARDKLELTHIAGFLEKEIVANSYNAIGVKNRVFSFTQDMDKLYNNCDFAIARAGAMTISELLSLAIPAILIPYPYAGGHQKLNAKALEKIGSAVLLEEGFLDTKILQDAMLKLMDRNILNEMSRRAKTVHKPDACQTIIKEIIRC